MLLDSTENTLVSNVSLTQIQKHTHTATRTDIQKTAVTIKCCTTAKKRGSRFYLISTITEMMLI